MKYRTLHECSCIVEFEQQHEISNNVVCATSKGSDQPVQSDQSQCKSFEYFMTVKLLMEQHFEFLSIKGVCTGLSESTPVKMTHCWKSHVTAHLLNQSLKRYKM